MDALAPVHNKRAITVLVGAIILAALAAGVLLFYFWDRDQLQIHSDGPEEAKTLEALEPLGSDPIALLREAEKRQKDADYYVEYDVAVTNPAADEQHSRMRTIEKKWQNNLRIDSYLGSARTNSIIKNDDGIFGCNIAENSKESPCYTLPTEDAARDPEHTVELGNEVFGDLIRQGAIEPHMVGGKEVRVGGMTRVCDGFEYALKGEALGEDVVVAFSRRLLPDVSSEDITDAKNALATFSVETSLCFDRETGVSLLSDTSATIGTTTERYTRTATTFFPRAEFSHTLTLKPLIEKDPTDSYFHGENRLGASATDDEFLYVGGKSGMFKLKDGEIISQEKVPGGVDVIKIFHGKMYVSNSTGVYAHEADGWKESLKVSYAGHFKVLRDELYVATFYGSYVLRNGAWVQPHASFKDLEWIESLAEKGGFLYAVNKDGGLYILDGGEWQLLQEVNPYRESQRFRERGERLFLLRSGDLFELRGGDIVPISKYSDGVSVNDFEVFDGKVYIGGYRGVYVAGEGFISDEKATGEVSDLIVYRGSLYMAGETAVYRLEHGVWRVVGDPYSFTRPVGLVELAGALYGFGPVGVSRLDEDSWTSVDLMSVSNLLTHRGRLYAVSFNKGMLHEIISIVNERSETFALPAGAKIITFPQ
ncbi:MAG: hypothetical protein A2676_02885 [Candidatus Sungbacteria bacterium RIFCSPHIGHO2_01_FULL_51_22]|uniref:Uncharacterized protein n=1 Tax=Candidatus Sungbacteria bacterium RIFCSPHIGHO2_02_FULL_51_29 TaxID=1802273 RepID=A0A1G2KTL3_9BACT|nr:MAG: hypothetical protein A2676_02885 [Candidatus Sungbacteria bacterium RIFCSPHIGHO2_01_FULL_51_22]OHA02818.1 MAG: hypothetical protein A3C16_01810 [Candidatus Sungbacteria bacterium RIFCSPHIGHO2_02_FULL_51_29]OHA07055.1 MAG: hypothetical protein A3B29_00205 [Candidatus Sungbacteria bacterium RIFCSPLOWO2_01_FULL_51_34]